LKNPFFNILLVLIELEKACLLGTLVLGKQLDLRAQGAHHRRTIQPEKIAPLT